MGIDAAVSVAVVPGVGDSTGGWVVASTGVVGTGSAVAWLEQAAVTSSNTSSRMIFLRPVNMVMILPVGEIFAEQIAQVSVRVVLEQGEESICRGLLVSELF